MVWADHISRLVDAWNRRRSGSAEMRPALSWTMIHLAMSVTLELMAPAGAVLSMTAAGMARNDPSTLECGAATLPPGRNSAALVLLSDMLSGVKIRWRMKSCHS